MERQLQVLDLFSGIGGFSLGLERAGMRTVAFCEIERFPRAVLCKHWPHVPIYEDVRDLTAARLAEDGITPNVICGGFPCQDISLAGSGAGLDGERSGLWREYRRLIEEIKPFYAIIENVSALRSRGLDQVLGSLAEIGYDAEWHCIPASAVGAPHQRDRIWIVANACSRRCGSEEQREVQQPWRTEAVGASKAVADTYSTRLSRSTRTQLGLLSQATTTSARREFTGGAATSRGCWATEPNVGRVANGVPSRVDRLRALGNSVVPQIPELIGRAIISSHISTSA